VYIQDARHMRLRHLALHPPNRPDSGMKGSRRSVSTPRGSVLEANSKHWAPAYNGSSGAEPQWGSRGRTFCEGVRGLCCLKLKAIAVRCPAEGAKFFPLMVFCYAVYPK